MEGAYNVGRKLEGVYQMDFLDYVKMCQEETMEEPEERRACRGQVYKVENGDTLYSISRKYNLRVRDLMQSNPFVNVYNLQVGDELCIPVVPGTGPETGVRPYVVKRDDTVLSILEQNQISFEDLARLNRSVAVLKIPAGTVLLIP